MSSTICLVSNILSDSQCYQSVQVKPNQAESSQVEPAQAKLAQAKPAQAYVAQESLGLY